jgi:adenosylcobinamide-GDP ribazoletransferase
VNGESASGNAGEPISEGRVRTELRLFLTAVMFYTRIKCPDWVGYSPERLNRSTRYFPAIGWIVGTVVAGVALVAGLALPAPVAAVLGLAAGVLLTGAFHEDGFADVCDGFGGGTDPRRTLDIMKDSRVGAYAAIGLVLLFGLKITVLAALLDLGAWQAGAAIVFAHVLSRWCVVTVIFRDHYAREDLTSKVKPIGRKITSWGMAAASAWLLPFAGLACWQPWWLLAIPLAFLTRLALAHWFRKRLGGYTGDCLGMAQQVIETVVLIAVLAALWLN